MDESVFTLLLKTAQGLTLFGTLRFSIDFTQPVDPAQAANAAKPGTGDVASLFSQVQQQATFDLFAYRIDGSVTIPFVTGLRPVPITGLALFTFLGPPATFITSSTDPTRNLFFQWNQLTNDNIAGGLVWRPGEPGELIFSALGTQLPV